MNTRTPANNCNEATLGWWQAATAALMAAALLLTVVGFSWEMFFA